MPYYVGQRIKIIATGQEGVITGIDADLPYIYMIRLDDRTYTTLSSVKIEPVKQP